VLEAASLGARLAQVVSQRKHQLGAAPEQALDERAHLGHDLGQVQRREASGFWLGEGQRVARQRGGAGRQGLDICDQGGRRAAFLELRGERRAEAEHGRQQVVQVVNHGRRHQPEGLCLPQMRNLFLQIVQGALVRRVACTDHERSAHREPLEHAMVAVASLRASRDHERGAAASTQLLQKAACRLFELLGVEQLQQGHLMIQARGLIHLQRASAAVEQDHGFGQIFQDEARQHAFGFVEAVVTHALGIRRGLGRAYQRRRRWDVGRCVTCLELSHQPEGGTGGCDRRAACVTTTSTARSNSRALSKK
jgi:hypothetical protein